MKAKTPILLLTVMLMVSSAFAVDPVEWSPVFVCGNAEIFPSMLIAVANVKVAGKDRDMIGIRIVSPSNNCRVKIELRADSIMDASDAEQTLPVAGHEYTIFPSINWRYDALAKVRQTIPLKMSISISIDGQAAGEMHQTISLHSINDCPFAFKADKITVDCRWTFGAYVNEDHPAVQQLLKEALQSGITNDFTGYQRHSKDEVFKQMRAVWYALQARGVKYSNITDTSTPSDQVALQHVRFINETLEFSQANCVDGSVLFASIFQKIGLHSYLVLVPGHCFVAVRLDDTDKAEWAALETTMIGTADLHRHIMKRTVSGQSFDAAVKTGNEELESYRTKGGLMLVDIGAIRRLGIRAIPYEPGEANAVSSYAR